MKLILYASLLLLIASSCSNTWDDESKQMFMQGCLEDAQSNGMPADKAKSMCDCRLEKVMKKYPKMEDAMNNIDSISGDPEIQACQ